VHWRATTKDNVTSIYGNDHQYGMLIQRQGFCCCRTMDPVWNR
jgi:hypothetical protein